jgi:hypothetical protein
MLHNPRMNPHAIDEFKSACLAAGFDEVLERQWAAHTVLPSHTHPFAVHALVTRGEMWLTVGEHTQHLLPGAVFSLDRDAPHEERYGAEGASYWVARKA